MLRHIPILSGAALGLFLVAAFWLGRVDRGGPPHGDLMLEGGVPATLYLPGAGPDGEFPLDVPPPVPLEVLAPSPPSPEAVPPPPPRPGSVAVSSVPQCYIT